MSQLLYVYVDTKNYFIAKGRNPMTYAEIGTEAFGRTGRILVNIAILANQTGVLAAYQQFIGKNFLHITTAKSVMPLSGWVLTFLVALVPLCWVRNIKYFAFTSLLGLVTVCFTVAGVTYHGVTHPTPP